MTGITFLRTLYALGADDVKHNGDQFGPQISPRFRRAMNYDHPNALNKKGRDLMHHHTTDNEGVETFTRIINGRTVTFIREPAPSTCRLW